MPAWEPDGVSIELRAIGTVPGAIITVSGPIDHDGAALLSRHLHGVFAGAATAVVVDLSGVPRCNATGVRVLVAARDHARSSGTELHLIHLNNPDACAWLTAAHLAQTPSRSPAPPEATSCHPVPAQCAP